MHIHQRHYTWRKCKGMWVLAGLAPISEPVSDSAGVIAKTNKFFLVLCHVPAELTKILQKSPALRAQREARSRQITRDRWPYELCKLWWSNQWRPWCQMHPGNSCTWWMRSLQRNLLCQPAQEQAAHYLLVGGPLACQMEGRCLPQRQWKEYP